MNDSLKQRIDTVKDSPYSVPIYIGTVFGIAIVPVLMGLDLCLLGMIIAVVAILVPYKLYKEPRLRKVVTAGAVAIVLIALVGTLFHVQILYSQSPETTGSENISMGTVDGLYGDTDTIFNFTAEGPSPVEGITMYLNLTFIGDDGMEEEISVEMDHTGQLYYHQRTLEEKQYLMHFTLESRENNISSWEETDKIFGPLLIPKNVAIMSIFIMRFMAPFVMFVLFGALLWWKRGVTKSKDSSMEGLEEKDMALDDACPDCGALLQGEIRCPDCDWYAKEEENKAIERERIKCPGCKHLVVKDNLICPYCGEDIPR